MAKQIAKSNQELMIDSERYAEREMESVEIENRTIRALLKLEIAKAYYQGFIDSEEYHNILAF